ncbi:MAG: energy-coupling factor transporter ATPase, partial [Clostridia bacterium]|nr:energy-coupling factor transporter ATPase [Clostridia bacterium]
IRADRVIVIDSGSILLDGTPAEVFSNVRTLKSVGLDVPQVTELLLEIREDGFNLPKNVLSYEEGARAIADYLNQKKGRSSR